MDVVLETDPIAVYPFGNQMYNFYVTIQQGCSQEGDDRLYSLLEMAGDVIQDGVIA